MNQIIYAGRHPAEPASEDAWLLSYCTAGEAGIRTAAGSLSLRRGEVVVIPPGSAPGWTGEQTCRGIHLQMLHPVLWLKEPALVRDRSDHELLHAFEAALKHFHENLPERGTLLSAYGSLISCYLSAYQTVQRHSAVVEAIEQHILGHYESNGYELDSYLRSLPFSYDYLRKLFQKEMGITPHRYLQDKRLQLAAEILSSPGGSEESVTDVARRCGFREPLYFSRTFKKKYGVSPSLYAALSRNA